VTVVQYRRTDGLVGTGLMPYKAYPPKYQHFMLLPVLFYSKYSIFSVPQNTPPFRIFYAFQMIPGLFVPLHFRSRERKDHRENFRSRGTFVPWNIRSLELSLLWNFRSSGAKVPRTFVPWNIRSRGTFVPRERTFQELSFL